jgi:hypothetical protein
MVGWTIKMGWIPLEVGMIRIGSFGTDGWMNSFGIGSD